MVPNPIYGGFQCPWTIEIQFCLNDRQDCRRPFWRPWISGDRPGLHVFNPFAEEERKEKTSVSRVYRSVDEDVTGQMKTTRSEEYSED